MPLPNGTANMSNILDRQEKVKRNPEEEFLVDTILPRGEVHLLAGPTWVGKTRFLLPLIANWARGEDVFGKKSYPGPYVYAACDRTMTSIERTLEGLGLLGEIGPIINRVNTKPLGGLHPENLLTEGLISLDTKLLVIEGLARLVPKGKLIDYNVVGEFLEVLTEFCQDYNMTIIGTVHATKVKKGQEIVNPRERILGSTAWGAYSDTIMILDSVEGADPKDNRRILYLYPRNAPGEKHLYTFDEKGRLIRSGQVTEDLSGLDMALVGYGPGIGIPTHMIVEWGEGLGMSRSTVMRWIKDRVDEGVIERMGKGMYTKKVIDLVQ